MPEPIKAGESSHTEQTANTPRAASDTDALQKPADEPKTTTQPRAQEKQPQVNSLHDLLDIPDDVRIQLQPKTVKPMEGELPAGHPKQEAKAEQTEQPEQPAEETEAKPAKSEDDTEEETEQEQQQPQGQKIDKRQKRIDRLTRKNSELEEQLDVVHSRLRELEGKEHGGADPAATTAIPSTTSGLDYIGDERTLNQEVTKARSLIAWCNENADGVTVTENSAEKFVDPKEVAAWKNRAEMVLLGSAERRGEIRKYAEESRQYDNIARQAWPELFDKQSEEYQLAGTLLETYPQIKSLPSKNYALGLLIEGMKSLNTRVQDAAKRVATGNGNGNGVTRGNEHRDISERAFEARVPLAPHTPGPPTREVVPSSHKRLNEAMDQLVADPDGSVANLANVLSAMDESKGVRRAGTRAPVKV
jgi:hypothetical protein